MPVSKLKLNFFIFFLYFPFSVLFYERQLTTYYWQFNSILFYSFISDKCWKILIIHVVCHHFFKKKRWKGRKIYLILLNSLLKGKLEVLTQMMEIPLKFMNLLDYQTIFRKRIKVKIQTASF